MEEIHYKYQWFNVRILFFVFMLCLWRWISNFLCREANMLSYFIFFFGLWIINYVLFSKTAILFKRNGRIRFEGNKLIFFFLRRRKIVQVMNIVNVTYNTMSTLNVTFGVLTIETKEEKDIKIYFEDISDKNKDYYISIYEQVKQYK